VEDEDSSLLAVSSAAVVVVEVALVGEARRATRTAAKVLESYMVLCSYHLIIEGCVPLLPSPWESLG
jgi:hypothetical protein